MSKPAPHGASHTPAPPPAPATAQVTAPAAASGGAHTQRLHQAGVEAAQGGVVATFQTYRTDIANWILDHVPGGQVITQPAIARMLPVVALLFKIATKPGEILDVADDIVQDIAQALKEEGLRRSSGGAPVQQPLVHPAPTVPATTDQYTRFLFVAMTSLGQGEFDALMAWHDGLNDDDKARFYDLCGRANDAQLTVLVARKPSFLQAEIAKIKVPEKPMTYLKLRDETAKDSLLVSRIATFLAGKTVKEVDFWGQVEKIFGTRINDKVALEQLMRLSDDEIYKFLNLAPQVDLIGSISKAFTEPVSAPVEAQVTSFRDRMKKLREDAQKKY